MELYDLTGPVTPEIWHYRAPYFPPQIESLASADWLDYPIYSEAMSMPMQSGTYIETAGHVYQNRVTTADLPLDKTVLLSSVCIQIPALARTEISSEMIKKALLRLDSPKLVGRGLIISTGWYKHWFDPEFLNDGPYFAPDAIDFMLKCDVSLVGADLPCWDNPAKPTGHLRVFFQSEALMLAPIYAADRLEDSEGKLIAAPLAVHGTSASPVRAVWVA